MMKSFAIALLGGAAPVFERVGRLFAAFAVFCAEMRERLRASGWHAAWAYLRWRINGRYVFRRNMRQQEPRVECPCCGWKGYDFAPLLGGSFWVARDVCPQCFSGSRHRAMQFYLTQRDNAVMHGQGRVLNLAPEPYIRNIIASQPGFCYISADLDPERRYVAPGRFVQMDIHRIPIPDASMDLVFCIHLLEHLLDERPAIAELFRVLKPGGIAYIMVPIHLEKTESVELGYPHPDFFGHCWFHARDFIEKLNAFETQEVCPHDYLSKDEQFRYGVEDRDILYRCVKPGGHQEEKGESSPTS